MKKFLKEIKWVTALMAILMILLGMLMILNPGGAVLTICRLVGCVLLITGVVLVVMFLVRKGWEGNNTADVLLGVLGVVLLAVGLYIAIRPAAVIGFVSILIAVILFFHAFRGFREIQELRRLRDDSWWISLFCTVLTVLMGILVRVSPFGSAKVMGILTGICLIFAGVSGLFMDFRVLHISRKIQKNRYLEDDIIDVEAREIK